MPRPVAVLFTCVLAFSALSAFADTPRGLWVKSKCALCHGEDGVGNTPAGKQTKVRDLGSPDVQKLTDADLRKAIVEGQGRMPAFKPSQQELQMMLWYVRNLPAK